METAKEETIDELKEETNDTKRSTEPERKKLRRLPDENNTARGYYEERALRKRERERRPRRDQRFNEHRYLDDYPELLKIWLERDYDLANELVTTESYERLNELDDREELEYELKREWEKMKCK